MHAARRSTASARRLKGSLSVLVVSVCLPVLAARVTAPPGMAAQILPTVSAAATSQGQRLFNHETFGGNGRTCRTCHSGDDGTIDPAEVAERLAQDPSDPLFVHDGLDDFFNGTSRIAAHATI